MKTTAAGYVEVEVDTSRFESIVKEVFASFEGAVPFSELIPVLKSGFVLQAKPKLKLAPGAHHTMSATLEPLDSLAKLLPALRTGELSFGAFKDILGAEVGIGDEAHHG